MTGGVEGQAVPSQGAASGAAGWLALDGEFTIYRAEELKPVLLGALAAGRTLEVDLSAVTEFDSAGVQLLMLAKREAAARGAVLKLSAHSPAVLEVYELMDLGAFFGDPVLVPAAA